MSDDVIKLRNHLPNNRCLEPVTVDVRVVSPEYRTGSTLQLDCYARGFPEPRIHWTLGSSSRGAPLQSDGNRYIFPNNTLFIQQLRREDSAEYRCVASNQYNEASSSVHITVEGEFAKNRTHGDVKI